MVIDFLINGFTIFLLINMILNVDLLKISQIIVFSSILFNLFLLNKKVLRNKKGKKLISYTQFGISLGIMFITYFVFGNIKLIFG